MYRQAINISSHSVGETNVYIIASVNIGTTTKANSNDGDFRFTDIDGKLLNYYIASGVGTTNITFHIYQTSFPSGAQTIYAYYGNPSAANGFALADFATQASSYAIGAAAAEETGGGPVAWWKFDEGVGTSVNDSSPNKNNGLITGATWVSDSQCISGKCLYFNGVNNQISLPSLVTFKAPYTVTIWVKPQKLSAEQVYFSPLGANSYPKFEIQPNNKFLAYSGAEKYKYGNKTLATSDLSQWHQLTYTVVDGTSLTNWKVYLDGQDITGTAGGNTGTYYEPSNYGYIGSAGGQQYFQGYLDDIRVYSYIRSTTQIKADYLLGSAGQSSSHSSTEFGSAGTKSLSDGLVGYWKFDEGIGTTSADSSGNNNLALLYNSPVWASGKYGVGISFNNSNNYIGTTITNLNSTAGGYNSVSFWMKWPGTTGDGILVFGAYYDLYAATTTCLGFNTGNSEVYGFDPTQFINSWIHVVANFYNGAYTGKNEIYVNGTKQTLSQCAGVAQSKSIASTSNFYIGDLGAGIGYPFGGIIDEMRVYNRYLNSTEVKALYNYAPGPVGYWKMDETSWNGTTGEVKDSSGFSNNGTGVNGITTTIGKFGKAGNFIRASQQYITVPDSSSISVINNQITMSAWVKPSTINIDHKILYKTFDNTKGYIFAIYNSQLESCVFFAVGFSCTRGASGKYNLSTNNWYYVTSIYDGTKIQDYINGQPYGVSVGASGAITATNSPLNIGKYDAANIHWFDGLIDDVKIYNYARTQEQILQDMTGDSVSSPHLGSPIAWYKFDEGAGSIANNSGIGGSALNGTISNATWSNGKFNKALSFNGSNSYVGTTNPTTALSEITMSAWINGVSHPSGYHDIWNNGSSLMTIYNGKLVYYQTLIGNIDSGTTIPTGSWQHIVITAKNNDHLKFYVNGSLVSDQSFGSTLPTPTSSGSIGSWVNHTQEFYNGLIDNVKIYNYALSSDEVKQDYNQGTSVVVGQSNQTIGATTTSLDYCIPGDTSPCAAPVAQWNFEEGTGTTAFDTSGNSNNGVFGTGSSAPSWTTGKIGKGLLFDGINDTLNTGSITSSSGSYTFNFWAKSNLAPTTGIQLFDSLSGRLAIGWNTDTSGKLGYYDSNSSWKSIVDAPNDGQWHYLSFVLNAGTSIGTVYIDGVNKGTGAYKSTNLGSTSAIGSRYDATNYYFKGSLDNIRIYNYARTPAQIAYDYNRGGPIGWWKFDDCQGNVANDSSGIGNTGTITIGVGGSQVSLGTCNIGDTSAWSNGKSGKINASISLDGTDDWVSLGNSANFNTPNDYSLAMWVYNKSGGKPYPTFLNRNNQGGANGFFWIYTTGTNNRDLNFQYANGSTYVTETFSSAIPLNTWAHVLFTFNSTTNALQLFINGTKFGTTHTLTTPLPVITGNLYFGTYQGTATSYPFYGQFDDFRLYNYALTTSQIKTLYNNGAVNFK